MVLYVTTIGYEFVLLGDNARSHGARLLDNFIFDEEFFKRSAISLGMIISYKSGRDFPNVTLTTSLIP